MLDSNYGKSYCILQPLFDGGRNILTVEGVESHLASQKEL